MLLDKDRIIINTLFVLIWVWCTFGFISEELLPVLQSLRSVVFFLCDAVIVMLGLIALKDRMDKIVLLLFLAVGYYVTCIYNENSALFYVNGLRDFIYNLWLIPILRYLYNSNLSNEFERRFDRMLFIFLIVQAVCITFQFLKYGANDHGGGSMGNGFSGVVSMMIYAISFYLMKKRFDGNNVLGSLVENKWLIVLLFPTFLNETKISFIFLALYFLLLMPFKKESLMKFMIALPLVIVVMYIVFNTYLSATGNNDDIMDIDYYLEGYLMADESNNILDWAEYLYENDELETDGTTDIPRFTKYIMIPELNEYYPGHGITGYGIGQFKGGTMIDNSKFYRDNEWLLRGSVPYGYHAYIQFGFFSVIFFVLFCVRLYSLRRKKTNIEIGIQVLLWSMIVMIMLYNDFFRYTFVCVIFLYIFTQSLRWNTAETKTIETK